MKDYYFSQKSKIRGWKRRKRKIEEWKQQALILDWDALEKDQRYYVKIWIPPFYSVPKRNPPHWYNQLIFESIIDIYSSWHHQLTKLGEPFYLRIWLYDPNFIHSQIVVAFREMVHFYDQSFNRTTVPLPFPSEKFSYQQSLIDQFEWESYVDEVSYFDEELNEYLDEGLMSLEEIEKIKSTSTIHTHSSQTGDERLYFVEIGGVWIGKYK